VEGIFIKEVYRIILGFKSFGKALIFSEVYSAYAAFKFRDPLSE